MKVFLSWSGERSKYVAQCLSEWLEKVLQALEPWLSSEIEKGKRWNSEITKKLEQSKVGIICLTKDNLESPWIHFEAGAISKTEDAYLCTFLFDITPANVREPLSSFQATTYTEVDLLKLLSDINRLISKPLKESSLNDVFKIFWPSLKEKLDATPQGNAQETGIRSERELIEEILQNVRMMVANSTSFSPGYAVRYADDVLLFPYVSSPTHASNLNQAIIATKMGVQGAPTSFKLSSGEKAKNLNEEDSRIKSRTVKKTKRKTN
jgi:hypothetical protein